MFNDVNVLVAAPVLSWMLCTSRKEMGVKTRRSIGLRSTLSNHFQVQAWELGVQSRQAHPVLLHIVT